MSKNKNGGLRGLLSRFFGILSCGLDELGAKVQEEHNPTLTPQKRELYELFESALTQKLEVFDTRLGVLDNKLAKYVSKINKDSEPKGPARETSDEGLANDFGVVLPIVLHEIYTQKQMNPFLTSIDRFADLLADAEFFQSARMVMIVFGGCLGTVLDPKIQNLNPEISSKYFSLVEVQFKKEERGPKYSYIEVLQTSLHEACTKVLGSMDRDDPNLDKILKLLYLRVDRPGQHHSLKP